MVAGVCRDIRGTFRKPRQSVLYTGAGLLSVESTLGPTEAGWHMNHAYKMAEALQSAQVPPVSIGLMKKTASLDREFGSVLCSVET